MEWVCDNCACIEKANNLIYMKFSPFLVGCPKGVEYIDIRFVYCTSCFFSKSTNCDNCGVYKAGFQSNDKYQRLCFMCYVKDCKGESTYP